MERGIAWPLTAFLILTDRGIAGGDLEQGLEATRGFFLGFLTVTFLNLMESMGKVDRELGVEAIKIERYFMR